MSKKRKSLSMMAPVFGLLQPAPAPVIKKPVKKCPRCHDTDVKTLTCKTAQLSGRLLMWTKYQCACTKVWIERTEH
jgi:hypothetical protein